MLQCEIIGLDDNIILFSFDAEDEMLVREQKATGVIL